MNIKIKCPVVVVGPPRHGTSITAHVLETRLGIKMGTKYLNIGNVIGHRSYEDFDLARNNIDFFILKKINEKMWKQGMVAFFRKMQARQKPWGFKDPRVTPGLHWIINYFNKNLTIIRCQRDKDLAIKSMVNKLKWTQQMAENTIVAYNNAIDKILRMNQMKHALIPYQEKHYKEERLAQFLAESLCLV